MKPKLEIVEAKPMMLLPPDPRLCQECAIDHEPGLPHNRDSLYYQIKFKMANDRWPTWHDAMSHCTEEVKAEWLELLKRYGADVSTQ